MAKPANDDPIDQVPENDTEAVGAEIVAEEEKTRFFSSTEPIECTVLKTFYDPANKLVSKGSTYFFRAKGDEVFPASILQPKDKDIAQAVSAEFKQYKREKSDAISRKKNALAQLQSLMA